MLVFFRSKPGESWIAALALVADAASLTVAVVDDDRVLPAILMYRRAVRTVASLTHSTPARLDGGSALEDQDDEVALVHRAVQAAGIAVHPLDEAEVEYARLRATYRPALERLAGALLSPIDFRGVPALPAGT